ncbi:deoxyribose-phosphate aldolase [Corynebacterium auris]|uniref:deoxyribose-phosphate aldolase n=1 Tax=Corynebacterium auris TaxID=44750 RepID=UPI0025B518A4|nr:deoxyribose-phosphate aldolase [Corynebacterium auris]WJY67203.1 deoxyribose-phosphate aldolase [Corynebacterium auris]
MDDLEWLATRAGVSLLGGQPPFRVDSAARAAGVVVEPTHVAAAAKLGVPVIAVVGWPTGRHHSVIKAAEARLAAETGAEEVWLAVDAALADDSAVLADIIAVRQAVPAPTRFGVIPGGHPAAVDAARRVGADALAVEAGQVVPAAETPVAVYGGPGDTDAIIAAMEAGAERVFADPAAP